VKTKTGHSLNSNSTIKKTVYQSLTSDSTIKKTQTQSIASNSYIKASASQSITLNSHIRGATYHSIVSNSHITTIVSLVGHWPLDDASGTTGEDATTNNNDITFVNTDNTNWVDGKVEGAFEFSGVAADDERGVITHVSELSLSSFTVMVWAKMGVQTTTGTLIQKLHGTLQSESGAEAGWVLGTGYTHAGGSWGSGKAAYTITDGSGNYLRIPSITTVGDDHWHHIALSYDGTTGTAKFYIDGALDRTNTNASIGTITNTHDLEVGAYSTGVEYDGIIDDIRLYNGILTLDEIKAIWLSQLGGRGKATLSEEKNKTTLTATAPSITLTDSQPTTTVSSK